MRVLLLPPLWARGVVFFVAWVALQAGLSHQHLASAALTGALATMLFVPLMWYFDRPSAAAAHDDATVQDDGAGQNTGADQNG